MCRFKMRRPEQLAFRIRTWGGRREGAGCKPAPGRARAAHHRRLPHDPRCPVHVTLRAATGVPSFRRSRVYDAVRAALAASSNVRFRVLHFSVQSDHVHLMVEADAHTGLRPGVQGLAIRVARAVNRVCGRHGRVWGDRFHARPLPTPREVRNALVYVLANWRKHVRGAQGLDPCSSARWFGGWRVQCVRPQGPAPVARAGTWLAAVGWRRHGLIDVEARPSGSQG
jgi:REP element-mobilizing transposase RayT